MSACSLVCLPICLRACLYLPFAIHGVFLLICLSTCVNASCACVARRFLFAFYYVCLSANLSPCLLLEVRMGFHLGQIDPLSSACLPACLPVCRGSDESLGVQRRRVFGNVFTCICICGTSAGVTK